jgi:DNA-directed RNA polymerase subunit F
MTQTNVEDINRYLSWVRDKQLYPPQNSPEEYAEWVKMSEARGKMILIEKLLGSGLTDEEFRASIVDIMYMEVEYEPE